MQYEGNVAQNISPSVEISSVQAWSLQMNKNGIKWTPLLTPFENHFVNSSIFVNAYCVDRNSKF